MDRSDITAKYGFALDSDGKVGNIIVAAPTQAKVRATIFGKTAHAGVEPEKASPRLQSRQKRSLKCRSSIDKETTANIGRFEGGTQTNIVCDQVDILAEARSLVPEKWKRKCKNERSFRICCS